MPRRKTEVAVPMGRKPKALTSDPAALVTFFNAVRAGMYLEDACILSKLDISTARYWLKRGESPGCHPQYAEFLTQFREAMSGVEHRHVTTVNDAAEGITPVEEIKEVYVQDPNNSAELVLVERTKKLTKGRSWQAAAWMLERQFPSKYGRLNRVQIIGRLQNEMAATVVDKLAPILTRNFERHGIPAECLAQIVSEIGEEFGKPQDPDPAVIDAAFEAIREQDDDEDA